MWTDGSKEELEKNKPENEQVFLLMIHYFYQIKTKCQIYWEWKMAQQLMV